MYFVKYGNSYLHDPRTDKCSLFDLKLDAEENSCGYCDFTIYPTNPMYGKIKERDADNQIEVYDGDSQLFAGFIYELGKEFYLDGHVKCKGELAYLSDSIVRPYSTIQKGYGNTIPASISGYFDWLIEQHNNQVKANKQFCVGINQGGALNHNAYIYRESNQYPSTIEEIKEKLLHNENAGGYLVTRHVDGVKYIDYLSEWTDANTQVLDFGVNLTDYTQTDDADKIATFIVPLGAKMSETGYAYNDGYYKTSDTKLNIAKEYYTASYNFVKCEGLSIFVSGTTYYEYNKSTNEYFKTSDTVVNSNKIYYTYSFTGYSKCSDDLAEFEAGVVYYEYYEDFDESSLPLTISGIQDGSCDEDGYVKSGDMIYCEDAVNKYGWIGCTYSNSDITQKENLCSKGIIALKEMISPKRTIEIKAVDMHLVNPHIKPIKIGEYVRVRSKPHNLDSYFLCTSISLDLSNPENSLYTLGTTYDTLTGQQNRRINALNSTINKQYEAAAAIGDEAKKSAKDAATTAEDAKKKADAAILSTVEEFSVSLTPSAAPDGNWSTETPEYTADVFIWRRLVTTYGSGKVVIGNPVLITGNSGQNGEDAVLLRIDSSRGTVFKNNSASTVLSAVIYKGSERIVNIGQLHKTFGLSAYLQWSWQKMEDNTFGLISSSDKMISDDGFTLTISANEVDTKVTFMCELMN